MLNFWTHTIKFCVIDTTSLWEGRFLWSVDLSCVFAVLFSVNQNGFFSCTYRISKIYSTHFLESVLLKKKYKTIKTNTVLCLVLEISTNLRNGCVRFFPRVCCNALKSFFQWWLKGTAKYFVSIPLICAVCFHTYCLSKPTKIEIWC